MTLANCLTWQMQKNIGQKQKYKTNPSLQRWLSVSHDCSKRAFQKMISKNEQQH